MTKADRDPPGLKGGNRHFQALPGAHFKAYRQGSIGLAMVEWEIDLGCFPNADLVPVISGPDGIHWQEDPCYWVRVGLYFAIVEQGFLFDTARGGLTITVTDEGFDKWGGDAATANLMRLLNGQSLNFGTLAEYVRVLEGVNPPEATLEGIRHSRAMLGYANNALLKVLILMSEGMMINPKQRFAPPEAECAKQAYTMLARVIGRVKDQNTAIRYHIKTDSRLEP